MNADPQPVWRASLGRGIVGAPALSEDLVAVAQVDRQLALLDRATGEVIWRRRFPDHLGAGPLLDFDRLYVAAQDGGGRIYAVALRTGKTVWSAEVGETAASLVLEDTVVYAGTVTGWVAALSTARGMRLWRTRVPGAVRAPPVPTSAGLVVASSTDSLFLLDRASGAVRVRRATRGTVLAAPALADSFLLLGTTGGRLEAIRPASLTAAWATDLGGGVVGSVAVRQQQVYTLTERGTLWRMPVAGPPGERSIALGVVSQAGPTPVAGGVFVTAVTGEVTLVDDETGARRWSTRLDAPVTQPVLVEGRLILAVSARGEVVAFR